MDLVRCPAPEDVARAAAERVAVALARAAGSHISHLAHLALAGGSTPMRCYELLGPMLDDWSAVHLWYSDERCVAPDHEDSNHRAASERLIAPGAHWHRMLGELGPELGPARYSAELDQKLLDVCMLGMGPDGHTASLFPEHRMLTTGGVAIGLTDAPKPPPERITLTVDKINSSHAILLLATGADKADALSRVLDEDVVDRAFPVTLLDRSRLTVIADAEALPGA